MPSDLHPDPLGALQRAFDGTSDAHDRQWLQSRWRAFLRAGGSVPLERALRLPSGSRQWALEQRNRFIVQATAHLDEKRTTHRARRLVTLLARLADAEVPEPLSDDPVIVNLQLAISTARVGGVPAALRWRQLAAILRIAADSTRDCNGLPVSSPDESVKRGRDERTIDAGMVGGARHGNQAWPRRPRIRHPASAGTTE